MASEKKETKRRIEEKMKLNINKMSLREITDLVGEINSGNECNCYIKGKGNGNVRVIIEEKLVRIG